MQGLLIKPMTQYSSEDIQPTMTIRLHDPSRIMAELIDRLEITGSGASRRSEKPHWC